MQANPPVWGMYHHADIIAKMVMVGLILASVVTRAIFFDKGTKILASKRRLKREQQQLAEARSLDQASDIANASEMRSLTTQLISGAQNELELSAGVEDSESIKERTGFHLEHRVAAIGRRMGRGNGYLATIGVISPFVNLFGTVQGIMNGFIGIAQTQTTSLAMVAPGIAEALLATVIGLFVAVPAVVIYNTFTRMISNYKTSLGDVVAQVLLLQSRDLDLSASGVRPVCSTQKPRVGRSAMAICLGEDLDDNGEIHEISVTLFIDVMLVLLIILMVTVPLATIDAKMNLPASPSQP